MFRSETNKSNEQGKSCEELHQPDIEGAIITGGLAGMIKEASDLAPPSNESSMWDRPIAGALKEVSKELVRAKQKQEACEQQMAMEELMSASATPLNPHKEVVDPLGRYKAPKNLDSLFESVKPLVTSIETKPFSNLSQFQSVSTKPVGLTSTTTPVANPILEKVLDADLDKRLEKLMSVPQTKGMTLATSPSSPASSSKFVTHQATQSNLFTFVNPFTVPLRQEPPEVYELLKEPRRKKDENVALSHKQHKAETDRIRNENTQRQAQHQQKLKERQQKKAEAERARLLSLRKPPAPFVQKTPEQVQLEIEAINKRSKEDGERRRNEFLEEEKLKNEELAAIQEIFSRETEIANTNLQNQLKKINDKYTAIENQVDKQYKEKPEKEIIEKGSCPMQQ